MPALTAIVLGSAAGGGFPQWNCRCPVCALAWAKDPRVRPRAQAALAVSADCRDWAVVNAPPDLRMQILSTAALQPGPALRESPIKAVVLTGAEIDQTAGLLSLRESQPFALYATATTLSAVADNPMFRVLRPECVKRQTIVSGQRFAPVAGIDAELFAVPGKAPLYLEDETAADDENCVGIEFRAQGKSLVYVPGAAALIPAVQERLAQADVVLFDGTLYRDDEMILNRTGQKTGRRMGHMPIDGPDGSLAALAGLAARRMFVHINNTNPILVDGSAERRRVEAAGWEVAEDGQEIAL